MRAGRWRRRRRDEDAAAQEGVQPLPQDLVPGHADRLVPEAGLPVAEAIAGPLEAPLRGRPSDLELLLVRVADERLARGAAGRHLEDASLVVVVGEQIEVDVVAHVGLLKEGQAGEVVQTADVGGLQSAVVEGLAVVGHVVVGVVDEAPELELLQLTDFVRRQPLATLQIAVAPLGPARDHPRVERHRGDEQAPPGPSTSCLGYNSTPRASANGKSQARTAYADVGRAR